MSTRRYALVVPLAVAALACSDGLYGSSSSLSAGVRVINASRGPIDVAVDGQSAVSGLTVANVSGSIAVTPGTHVLHLSSVSGGGADVSVTAASATTVTTFAYSPTATSMTASVLVDTGGIVPAGKSKLRVSHLSANAGSIEIWRTQPDFGTPVHIMTPFDYLATSPYLQSDPGNWEVFVTPAGSTTKLATTGAVNVPNGERRTVVLLDSAGVLRLKVIVE